MYILISIFIISPLLIKLRLWKNDYVVLAKQQWISTAKLKQATVGENKTDNKYNLVSNGCQFHYCILFHIEYVKKKGTTISGYSHMADLQLKSPQLKINYIHLNGVVSLASSLISASSIQMNGTSHMWIHPYKLTQH